MEFQDIAKATVEDFNRYADRHVIEGQALALEVDATESARKHPRLHFPVFHLHHTRSTAR